MRVGIMQPYFFPYIGYWQLIKAVDKYVIYDDVNYKKRGWINKNNILVNGEARPISLRTFKVSQNKRINEIEIDHDLIYKKKLLKTIKEAYGKAPYFQDVFSLVEKIINYREANLAAYLTHSIKEVCAYLNIQTEIILSSKLVKSEHLRGQDKILEICGLFSADEYLNAAGGLLLYSPLDFQVQGIELKIIKTNHLSYQQRDAREFVPNLSIIDVMMFNSPEEIDAMLNDFTVLNNFSELLQASGSS
ncbi:WbqC family protein [Planococcus halocryophilus]|uniref:WbqC family protein n=1 Tax=Planococcus halocryophilus TaxID=1215089 RepID=UPI001F1141F5|nr:WbqC family protein [Planococcus halocryophilus]MCH4825237.1 WbqC family protein [Planococcus halocryophilus]